MCLGGAPKAPSPTPPPAPAPVPIEPQAGVVKPKDQLERMRFGLASTIKTGPRGITGTGANLSPVQSAGKAKLG